MMNTICLVWGQDTRHIAINGKVLCGCKIRHGNNINLMPDYKKDESDLCGKKYGKFTDGIVSENQLTNGFVSLRRQVCKICRNAF